ncbi:MAG TPA: autotransporter domain-containing protein [Stellaceae bacterium]|jgi:autotransporter-associated beta strand protein|nr:autotransporter domain-containing protein [Stellaceae bacterium]
MTSGMGLNSGFRAALLSSVAGPVLLLGFSGVAAAQGVTTSFSVGGNVVAPQSFNLGKLQALPSTTENVSFLAGSSTTKTTFTGTSLFNLLNTTVGIKVNPAVKNDILRNVVIATGSDGYQAVSVLGEINPTFGGNPTNPDLVAYANNPGQLLTSDGFARTTVPGDIRGGRYVSNLQSLTVMHDPILTGTFAGGLSTQFTVTGQVGAPATFNLQTLTALPATTVTVAGPAATYTGVPVWTLLNNVGVTTNPAVKNNILRDYLIATGSDGFQATVSLGEIDPDFGGSTTNPDIIAYAMNGGAPGVSLGANGFARLITPGDSAHGRWVSNLINLEVFDVSQWQVSAGQTIDLGNFAYQTLGFTLNGGTLASTGGPGTLTAPTYTLNGGLIDTNATLGSTGVAMQASGLTALKGTIGTPNVAITGGTLQLEANNRLAAATTLNMTGGNFDLNGFGQTLSTLNGAGSILLSSNTGGGALTVGSGTFSGSISNNGSQAGSLVVNGPGTFNLTGQSSFTGPTTVNGGTLAVNGGLAASAVTVNPGGILGGNGTVGATNIAGGKLSPGNSIGTLTVNGNLTFSPAGTYVVEVSPSAADRTNVTGTAKLAGTVQAALQSGLYLPGSYSILSASAVNGTFGALNAAAVPTGLAAGLSYTPTVVNLNLTSILGQTGGLNGNQLAVAGAIDNGFNNRAGAAGAAFTGLYGAAPGTLPRVFSQLSGEIATGAPTASFQAMDQFIGQMLDPFLDARLGDVADSSRGPSLGYAQGTYAQGTHLAAADPMGGTAMSDAGAAPGPYRDPYRNWASWGTVYGSTGTIDGVGGAGSNTLDTSNTGGAGGIDYRLSPNTLIGVAVGGGGTDWSLSGLGTGHSDDVQGGIYGLSRFGDSYLSAAFAYAHHDLSFNRSVAVGAVLDRLTADVGADHVAGRVEAGHRFAYSPTLAIVPYAAVDVQSFDTPAYGERDATGLSAFALNYAAKTTTDTRTELGARFDSQPLAVAAWFGPGVSDTATLVFRGRAAWSHDFSPDRTALASFQSLPGSNFAVAGAPAASDTALLSAGVELRLAPNVALAAKFDGAFAGRNQVYAGTAALRITW